jgi:hypothetical protein
MPRKYWPCTFSAHISPRPLNLAPGGRPRTWPKTRGVGFSSCSLLAAVWSALGLRGFVCLIDSTRAAYTLRSSSCQRGRATSGVSCMLPCWKRPKAPRDRALSFPVSRRTRSFHAATCRPNIWGLCRTGRELITGFFRLPPRQEPRPTSPDPRVSATPATPLPPLPAGNAPRVRRRQGHQRLCSTATCWRARRQLL